MDDLQVVGLAHGPDTSEWRILVCRGLTYLCRLRHVGHPTVLSLLFLVRVGVG